MSGEDQTFNRADWYTATEAAERLTANSGRKISPDYVRSLARYNRVTILSLGTHANLYSKADIDTYIVEGRGTKSARAKRQRAIESKEKAIA
jgi:hypothetical protein